VAHLDGGDVSVTLAAAALAAPGQACVLYRVTQVLGGGFITAGAAADAPVAN
jgi:tRNA-specific 2-thiouridylase